VAKKYYVVWVGKKTGIFTDWPTAQSQVKGHAGAKFKSYKNLQEAEAAFASPPLPPQRKAKTKSSSSKAAAFSADPNFDVHIYCDGGCDPNPGKAGSGVVVYQTGKLVEMYHGLFEPNGTNNTAELNALHQAMLLAEGKLGEGLTVQILSDSSYSVKAMTEWAAGWQAKSWKRKTGELANADLIKTMYDLYCRIERDISIIHVKAHSGIEGNELADRLSTLAMKGKVAEFKRYVGLERVAELLAM
jgi:ribonuclease HI